MDILYTASNVTIFYDGADGILHCIWKGPQSQEDLRYSGQMILEHFRAKYTEDRCCKVLNDNRLVVGSWYHSVDWTSNEWFNAMFEAGLTHFAWVLPPDIFALLSAQRAQPRKGMVKTFESFQSAVQWLHQLN